MISRKYATPFGMLHSASLLSHKSRLQKFAKAIGGANRRALLAEFWRLSRGRGVYQGCENETTRLADDLLSVIPATAVLAQLLVQPKLADRIVRGTIENYALPEAGVRRIESLPADLAEQYFRDA